MGSGRSRYGMANIHSLWQVSLIVCLLTLLSAQAGANATADQQAYSLGVLPYLIPRHMAESYGPATANISRETGLSIHLRTTSNFPKFLSNLRAQRYDFVIVQPFDLIQAVDELNYRPLARISIELESTLVVLDESPYKTLNDLRGKVIAMAPKPAATSRMGRVLLQGAGLNPKHDLKIKYFSSHDSCLQAVLNRRADACMTAPPPLKQFQSRTGTKMRVIATAPSIPHVALLAHARVDDNSAKLVQKVFLSWQDTPEGKKILKKMAFPGWIAAKKEDYDNVRQILAADSYLRPRHAQQNKQDEDNYTFGVFPYFPPKQLAQQLAPIPLAFGKALNKKVHLRTSSSFTGFAENVEAGLYDIIFVQPFDYKRAKDSGYMPLAQLSGSIAATFYVTTDSALQDLQSLRDKSIAMPPAETAVSRLGIVYLKEQGLIPDQKLRIQYRRSHDSCIEQVLDQQVSACVSTRQVVQMLPDKLLKLRVLDSSPSIPSILVMAHRSLPQSQRDVLRETILTWDKTAEGRELLHTIHYEPFIPFVERNYLSLPANSQVD